MTHRRRTVSASGAPQAAGPYSHGAVAGGVLYCSGQVPLDPATGRLVEGTVGEQTTQCLRNLAAVCAVAGTSLEHAVRCTVSLTDLPGDWGEVNEAYGGFFASDPPARVAIGVVALPLGARVEVDAVVALPD
jgi:2-iminobutanoate/2-iminopropanoate deaminase